MRKFVFRGSLCLKDGMIWAFLLLMLQSCSDSSDNNDYLAEIPKATVLFPQYFTITEASTMTLRGTARDDDGIASVSIDGDLVDTDDLFENWELDVSLEEGLNEFFVRVEDNSGYARFADVVYVLRQPQLATPLDTAYDPVSDRLFVADRHQSQLFFYAGDDETGQFLFPFVSSTLLEPVRVDFDSANSRLLVLDQQANALVAVDLGSGSQTVVSSAAVPDALNPFDSPVELAVNAAGTLAWAINGTNNQVLAIDLATGARTVVASLNTAPVVDPTARAMDVDEANNRLIIISGGEAVALDLGGGGFSLLADETALGLPNGLTSLVIDAANNRALISAADQLAALDLTTNAVSTAFDLAAVLGGDVIEPFTGLSVDGSSGKVYALLGARLLSLDLSAGSISALYSSRTASSPAIGFPEAPVLNESTGDGYFYDNLDGAGRLIFQDFDRGRRLSTIVEDFDLDSGGISFALDSSSRTLYAGSDSAQVGGAVARGNQVVSVNLVDASVAVLSDTNSGLGPALSQLTAIALDATQGRLLAIDSGLIALLDINLITGDRTVLSDAVTPNADNAFLSPVGLTINAELGVAFVADAGLDAVIAVDLLTGQRTIVTDSVNSTATTAVGLESRLSSDGGDRLFMSIDDQGVVEIDRITGQRTVLASNMFPSDNLGFTEIGGLVFDGFCDCLYVGDRAFGLMSLDTQSGQRVVLSR